MIKVKFFGKLAEKFGKEMEIHKKFDKVEDVVNFLITEDESIKEIKEHLLFSINHKRASLNDKIDDGDEISIFLTPTGG